MAILEFPPVETASPEGLLALGGDMEVESLLLAYRQGIFPWPTEDFPLLWFSPPERAILDFKDFKVSKRMDREIRAKKFTYAIDRRFYEVIAACAAGMTRKTRGTWITRDILKAYRAFHEAGYAHSFECYNARGKLVGGMYGVSVGRMLCGESMFYHESGASKAALIYAVRWLQSKGASWLDVQMPSPLVNSLGAKPIPRPLFLKMLKKALVGPPLFPLHTT